MTTTSVAAASAYDATPAARLVLTAVSFVAAAVALLVEPVVTPVFLVLPTIIALTERTVRDAVTFLTAIVVALTFIPSGAVVGPLGSAGRPAGLLGIAALWWWFHARLVPEGGAAHGFQPVRLTSWLFALAVLASYAAALVRTLAPDEASGADRSLLLLLGLLGILLLAADGIDTRERLDVLLRRVTMAGTFVAAIGAIQFIAGANLDVLFDIPGLTQHTGLQGIQTRSDFNRVSATAAHPIEFGVVLGMIFPIAVHYAMFERHHRVLRWMQVAVIAAAVPMSVSRSGSLAFGVSALVIWASWPVKLKVRSALVSAGFAVVMRLAVPGLLGTIRSLFTSFFVDDSIKGRTEDYPLVGRYLVERPAFGRGFGTFLPERYFFLDNQYLGLVIETGAIGTICFLLLMGTGIGAARGSRHHPADDERRSLGQALAAAVAAATVSAATFDLLSFGMVAGMTFLLVGCAGAAWRLNRSDRAPGPLPSGAGSR